VLEAIRKDIGKSGLILVVARFADSLGTLLLSLHQKARRKAFRIVTFGLLHTPTLVRIHKGAHAKARHKRLAKA
jgi:hypothetical protein